MEKKPRAKKPKDTQLEEITNIIKRDLLIIEIDVIKKDYKENLPKTPLCAEIDRQTGYGEFRAKEARKKILNTLRRLRRLEVKMGLPTDITDEHIAKLKNVKGAK